MKNWYRIAAQGKSAEILIYDEIGVFGIAAKKFIADLKALGSVEKITLAVNSPGGDVFDGIAIYNALKRHAATVTARVDGIAASIASVILMAADKIVMPDNAMLMIHNPWGGVVGEADDMRDFADALDKIKVAILAAYRRSGKTDEELAAIMDAETWYTADEAKANGFADEVVETVDIAAFFDLSKFEKAPEALRAKILSGSSTFSPPAEDSNTRAREIFEACAKAGVPAAAGLYLDTPWTAAEIAARLEHAPAIREICKEHGAEQRAAHYVMFGFHPDNVREELKRLDSIRPDPDSYQNQVFSLCSAAGVPELSSELIAKNMTVEEVRERLADASKIRAACAAAKFPKRASEYIKAGLKVEEVRNHLFDLMQALQGPEIDNKFFEFGEQPPRHKPLTVDQIYRNRNTTRNAEELGRKIARVIEDHGGMR